MTGARPGAAARGWWPVAALSPWVWPALAWTAILVAWWPSFATMAAQWAGSSTYAYGFLVLPGALFLAWQRRGAALAAAVRPAPALLGLIAVAAIAWVAGRLANLQVLHHAAAASLLVLSVWTIMGHAVARTLAWPLLFLLFLVPEGQFLVPPLMDFTADFTALLARASGVPVFRDDMVLSTPSGDFEIIAACSGVRFLLASVAVGFFVAGAAFRTWRGRVIFMAAAISVPLIANGLRTYGIVMLGHITGMRVIIDHGLVGQVFFAAVIFALCLLGMRYGDAPLMGAPRSAAAGPVAGGVGLMAGGVMLLTVLAPLLLAQVATLRAARPLGPLPALAPLTGAWQGPAATRPDWDPAFLGAASEATGRYISAGRWVDIYVAAYGHQRDGAELVNPGNLAFDPGRWRVTARASGDRPVPYAETVLSGPAGDRLIRAWYLVDGLATREPRAAKLAELADLLSPTRSVGAYLAVGTPLGDQRAAARARLDAFLEEWCAAPVPATTVRPCGR